MPSVDTMTGPLFGSLIGPPISRNWFDVCCRPEARVATLACRRIARNPASLGNQYLPPHSESRKRFCERLVVLNREMRGHHLRCRPITLVPPLAKAKLLGEIQALRKGLVIRAIYTLQGSAMREELDWLAVLESASTAAMCSSRSSTLQE